jgi:hypothetical protein
LPLYRRFLQSAGTIKNVVRADVQMLRQQELAAEVRYRCQYTHSTAFTAVWLTVIAPVLAWCLFVPSRLAPQRELVVLLAASVD